MLDWMEITRNHTFPGSIKNKDRNHRIAEVLAMCMRAGIEVRPYLLPKFQFEKLAPVRLSEASMYLAKDLKKLGEIPVACRYNMRTSLRSAYWSSRRILLQACN